MNFDNIPPRSFIEYRRSIYASVNGTKGNMTKLHRSRLLSKAEKATLNEAIEAMDRLGFIMKEWRIRKYLKTLKRNSMKIEIIPEVGDKFIATEFYYTNPHGGTNMSHHTKFNELFKGEAVVKITKVWYDDETGYNAFADALSNDLIEYLKRNAKPDDQTVWVSQFNLKIIDNNSKN